MSEVPLYPPRGCSRRVPVFHQFQGWTKHRPGIRGISRLAKADSPLPARKSDVENRRFDHGQRGREALPSAHRVSSSLLGPVVPSFRALSGRLNFTVRRHKFNKDSLPFGRGPQPAVHRPGRQDLYSNLEGGIPADGRCGKSAGLETHPARARIPLLAGTRQFFECLSTRLEPGGLCHLQSRVTKIPLGTINETRDSTNPAATRWSTGRSRSRIGTS